ncbi:MAG: sterol desaturase family protein [Kordiimonadaceae bacterium]|nr:sterol desaturase family protein [Kordiimonadaceae bacterium]
MQAINRTITYGLYPLLLLGTGFLAWNGITKNYTLTGTFITIAAGRFVLLQGIELAFPCKREWAINWKNLWRDVKFGLVNFLTLRAFGFAVALITIDLAADNPGLLAGAPLWAEIIAAALVYEFLQYWVHRVCHEGKGWIGEKLWKIHVAHHLPDRVYMVMHTVGHPLNFLMVLWFVPLSTWLLGTSAEAVMVWFSFRGLHGLLSHYNVEIRAGWLNYFFVGTELHRYHHSAALDESKNYGSLLVFWDQVFGTFVYRPGVNPARLGVENPADYPESFEALKVLALPFRKAAEPTSEVAKVEYAKES